MVFKSDSGIKELSQNISFSSNQSRIIHPAYGRFLEDFKEKMVFEHPRGITFTPGLMYDFAMTFFEANPLYMNLEYAKAHGHLSVPASPLLVMNIALSLGVQNNSEKAYANLGYYDMQFIRPVYAGDTLRAVTQIKDKKIRGEGKPGIITLHTIALNQKDQVVIEYSRKIMVLPRPQGEKERFYQDSQFDFSKFANQSKSILIPEYDINTSKQCSYCTGHNTYYENYSIGDVVATHNGRTISDEHFAWTYKLGNTHPLHFDKIFTKSLSGAMSGQPIIYGGLIFAWLLGLAGRDISENAIWDLGYTEGYHTQPAKSGDTIFVIHRVIGEEKIDPIYKAGIKQFQVIGLINMSPREALDKYAGDLFIKENDKKRMGKEKISAKIFEIERCLFLKSRQL